MSWRRGFATSVRADTTARIRFITCCTEENAPRVRSKPGHSTATITSPRSPRKTQLIARCEDSDLRREWRSRLNDHDGDYTMEGGIERWLRLTDGLGLDRDYVTSLRGLLPAT